MIMMMMMITCIIIFVTGADDHPDVPRTSFSFASAIVIQEKKDFEEHDQSFQVTSSSNYHLQAPVSQIYSYVLLLIISFPLSMFLF